MHDINFVIAEGSRDGSAKKYANKGGIRMITNTTGIPTSHTHTHAQVTLVNTSMSLSCGAAEDVCVI